MHHMWETFFQMKNVSFAVTMFIPQECSETFTSQHYFCSEIPIINPAAYLINWEGRTNLLHTVTSISGSAALVQKKQLDNLHFENASHAKMFFLC